MSDLTITLPPVAQLFNELLQVSDTAILRIHFYPHVLEKAGKEVTPVALVLTFVAGINECAPHYSDTSMRILFSNLPRYVEILSVGNKAFEAVAKRLLLQVKKNL